MSDDSALTREPEPKLTAEAEKAVRSYLWKCIGPTSVVFVLVAGALGFFIRDIAHQQAYNKALSDSIGAVQTMAQGVATAKGRVDVAVERIAAVMNKVEQTERDAKRFDTELAGLEQKVKEAVKSLTDEAQVRRIAEALASDPKVMVVFEEAARGVNTEVAALREGLKRVDAALQVDCVEGKLPTQEQKPKKFNFTFPVKHAWVEFAGPVGYPTQFVKTTIDGRAVRLTLEVSPDEPPYEMPTSARCRVCATAF